jgi:cytochrome c
VDNYEWNRLAGWVLAAAAAILGLSIITGIVYAPRVADTKGYKVEGVVEEVAEAGAAAPAEQPIAMFLASADVARGEAQFKKCAACHTIDQGGANGIGPNLHGILGAQVAARPGFGYSDALKGKGGQWDWEAMNQWLQNPRGYIAGNKMSFAGLSKPQDRADVMAYLNAQSGRPLPLPEAPVAEAAPDTAGTADEAAADGSQPAGEDGSAAPAEGEAEAAADAEAAAAGG